MTSRTVADIYTLKAEVDSGDLILLGPSGEPARVTMQRDRSGVYAVKSGDGRQSYTCPTWEDAGKALLKIVEAA